MDIVQNILMISMAVVWLMAGICLTICTMQTIMHEYRCEKRARANEARDLEYHEKRMSLLK